MVRPYYLPFFKRAYSRCRRLILVSESQKKGIDALVPFAMKRVQVIPNMIRADQFRPPSEARKADPFVFLWAGRLEHVKGIDLLLDAAKILADKSDRPFIIRLAGKGSRRRDLERQAKKLGLKDRILFLGRLSRDEILQELQGANCFVLPSRYEAFGVALIEAMATGLPVIATASGGPDLVVTRDNGLLIDRGDPRSLAWAMGRMMATITDYSSGLIRDSTLQVYGDAAVMKQYDQLLGQLLRE
jgi:glycosyltransferase involved in cell wall biosynthesis